MLKRTLKVFAKLAKNKNVLSLESKRCFATTKGADNLKKCLEKEITYEETNYQSVSNDDQAKFLKDNHFVFSEKEGSTQLELKRTVDNLEVHIAFQAK